MKLPKPERHFNAEIDLSKESNDELTAIGKQYHKKFMAHKAGILLFGIVSLVLSLLIPFAIPSPGAAPTIVRDFIVLAMVGLLGLGGIWALINGLIGVFGGYPKSFKTPEKTAEKFIDSSYLLSDSDLFGSEVESFVCLLRSARELVNNNLKEYASYYQKRRKYITEIVNAINLTYLVDRIGCSVDPPHSNPKIIAGTKLSVSNIDCTHQIKNIILAKVLIKQTCTISDPEITFPNHFIEISLPLVSFEDRWYICTLDHKIVISSDQESEGILGTGAGKEYETHKKDYQFKFWMDFDDYSGASNSEITLKKAIEFSRRGEIARALFLINNVLINNPDNSKAMIAKGLCYAECYIFEYNKTGVAHDSYWRCFSEIIKKYEAHSEKDVGNMIERLEKLRSSSLK